MKTITTVAILVASFMGSLAHAGNFLGSNPAPRAIAIPGITHFELSPLAQCQLESSALKNKLEYKEEEITALQDQVAALRGQVDRLTPGTCAYECSGLYGAPHDAAHTLYTYDDCVTNCQISKGIIDRDDRTAEALSRW